MRDGLEFHDGKPVTGEDVVASIARWGKRDAMGQKLMTFVDRMDSPAPNTFRIFLREACGFVLEALGKPSSNVPFIMPKRVADTDAFKQIEEHIGSGPYVFKRDEFKPGDKAVYVKNTKYKPRKDKPSGTAGGKFVYVDRVEWNLALRDGQAQVNALAKGEIDVLERPAFESYEQLRKADGVVLVTKDPLGFQYMGRFNHLHPPFNNPKIRQAALAAMQQEPFLRAQVGIKEFYKPCASMFTCGTPYGSAKGSDSAVEVQHEEGAGAAQGLRLRRHPGGDPQAHRPRRDPEAAGRGGAAAAPGRLQGGPAGDGLEHGGVAPREEGAAGAGRLEHLPHRVGRAGHLESAHQRRGRRAGREVLVRLADGRSRSRSCATSSRAPPTTRRRRRWPRRSRCAPSRSARTRRSASTSTRSPRARTSAAG